MFGQELDRVSFGSSHHVFQAGTRETHFFNCRAMKSQTRYASIQGDCSLFASSLHAIENRGDAGISDSQGPALRFSRQERAFRLSSLLQTFSFLLTVRLRDSVAPLVAGHRRKVESSLVLPQGRLTDSSLVRNYLLMENNIFTINSHQTYS